MVNIEKEILGQSTYKPLVWKRFIDDVFSLWNITKHEVDDFIEQANKFHPTIKFAAEISQKKIFIRATHQVLQNVFSKGKHSGFFEQTPLKLR